MTLDMSHNFKMLNLNYLLTGPFMIGDSYSSEKFFANIASGNGLVSDRHQSMSWIDADFG